MLHLEGRLTVEEDTRQLHELVRAMVRFAPGNVVLDLGNVGQLDCSGIGQLVQIHEQVRGSGGAFALLNVERRQKRLLQLLKLLGATPGVSESRYEAHDEVPERGRLARRCSLCRTPASNRCRATPDRSRLHAGRLADEDHDERQDQR
ncbi:MAG: STAS domain-containing protein [Desulfomicrobium escambiense]|nr:STAS domain-containing protein [Desulfomicrobium escambiense]